MKTPVAFIIFNRPDKTAKVFEAIRQAKPPKLFVFADGPREDRLGESEKCAATRSVIDSVDWECEVLTNYSDVNLGMKLAEFRAFDWVFNNVEEAIFLEDDCLPHITFFRFCEEMLEYYRTDERITAICGCNFQFGRNHNNCSYYFSRIFHGWGWAGWRRSWQNYDLDMKLWTEIRDGKFLEFILKDKRALQYWTKTFQDTYDGVISTWDHQFTLASWSQNGLTVMPNSNLITNVGFGQDATNTKGYSSASNVPHKAMVFPLKHPPFMMPNIQADSYTQTEQYSLSLLNRIKRKSISILHEFSRGDIGNNLN
jgi:hypothetical protein